MKRLYLITLILVLIMSACAPNTADNSGKSNDAGLVSEAENSFEKYPIKIFKADGVLYYDTGEYVTLPVRKCGTLDGMFEEVCDEYEIPKNDGEANFDSEDAYYENGWQTTGNNIKEVPTTDGWRIFRKFETDLKTDLSDYKYCMRICGKFSDDAEKSEYIVFTNNKEVDFSDVSGWLEDGGSQAYLVPIKYGEAYNWGLTLSAKDVTSKGLTLVFTQKGGTPKGILEFGEEYSLEVWNGEYFDRVLYKINDENLAWNMVAYLIQKDAETEFDINWEFLYGTLEPGKYRISKEVSDFVVANSYDKHTYYAEFEIGE